MIREQLTKDNDTDKTISSEEEGEPSEKCKKPKKKGLGFGSLRRRFSR